MSCQAHHARIARMFVPFIHPIANWMIITCQVSLSTFMHLRKDQTVVCSCGLQGIEHHGPQSVSSREASAHDKTE